MSKVKFNEKTNTLFVPEVTGVVYKIDGEPVSGSITIKKDTTIVAEPYTGYSFPEGTETEFHFKVTKSPASSSSEGDRSNQK